MKIAIWHNLPSGGAKRSFHYEVRELVRRGHTVESWCPPTADQSFLSIGELVPEHIVPFEWQDARRSNPFARLLSPYRNIVGKLAAMDEHCRRCAEQINRGGFDILFGNGCMFFRVTAISRFVNIPKTIYLGEPYRWLYEAMPRLPWVAPQPLKEHWREPHYLRARLRDELRMRGLRVQMREELRNAQAYDSILVNSLYSRESLLKAYGLNAQLRYPGIDTELFARRDLPKGDYVVGIGAFVREKNIGLIIEALGAVEGPRPRLIWIGNVAAPGLLGELTQLAALRGVVFEPRVCISDAELVETLNRALAMVYAPRLEPFGLAPLEANACGLPVVAVAEGGVRETIVDGVNGLLVEHDPAAMARAIERLRDNPDYAQQLGDRAEHLVHERWSLSTSIDRLERRFEEVIDARRG
jgi:glycosyltransferase involved in cell wall biosynthesis